MTDDTVSVLKREAARLREELADNPAFQKLQRIQELIALYDSEPAARSLPPVRTRTRPTWIQRAKQASKAPRESKTAAIDRVASGYLRKKGARAFSGELMDVIEEEGIKIGGKVPSRVLASFLSNSDLFDNVRGEGYGLKEWGGKPPQKDEAPTGDSVGASSFTDEGSRPSSSQTEE